MASAVAPKDRIVVLDVLRGFALLGILLVNIISFATISSAYNNPPSAGDFSLLNKLSWMFIHVFAESKFMAIFSMLFGAGISLFLDRLQKKGRSHKIHFRRNLVLFIIGFLHAYLVWFGDILVCYSLCAFVLYFMRNVAPKTLISIGMMMLLVPILLVVLLSAALPYIPENDLQDMKLEWQPTPQQIEKEVYVWQKGSWVEQQSARAIYSFYVQTVFFFAYSLWWAMGWMLIGMSLYKIGILVGDKNKAFYLKWFFHLFCTGLTLTLIGVVFNLNANFSFEYSGLLGTLWHYVGAIFMAISYVYMLILFTKSKYGNSVKNVLACIGKMSLTNYLMQSFICSFIFYSFGLGWFAKVTYFEMLCIVFAIWIFQIIFSSIWLKFFTFGPFEKLWRYLTYGKSQ